MTDELLGLSLEDAKGRIDQQSLKYEVVRYYAKRIAGEEERVIRANRSGDTVSLVVSGFSHIPKEKQVIE